MRIYLTHKAKHGCEHDIEETIRKIAEWPNARGLGSGDNRVRAGIILLEGWRGTAEVPATIELGYLSAQMSLHTDYLTYFLL